LHQAQLIFLNVHRINTFPFRLISAVDIPLIAIGKDIETLLKAQLLESGVDDYIEKDCHIREVVARVRSILRRSRLAESKYGRKSNFAWSLDPVSRHLRAPNGFHVTLSELEFELMKALLESPGRIFSSYDLMKAMFLDNSLRSQARVARAVGKIRSKLITIDAGCDLIRTIQGKGYRLSSDLPNGGS
jgi:two-component system, OmpR family, response regulator BaeR